MEKTKCGQKLRKGRGLLLCALLLCALLLLALCALDVRLAVRTYTVDLPRVEGKVRLALIADLHSCSYGRDQRTLLDALEKQKPDAVILCGDFFDDRLPLDNARLVLESIGSAYPCYYVTGNHEYWSDASKFHQMMTLLEENHVENISGQTVQVQLNGQTLNFCGVDDPENPRNRSIDSQLLELGNAADRAYDSVLICHRPGLFDTYCIHGFNLVLSGHAHGGQWRIPGLLNGFISPDWGFFPDYAGGRYDRYNATMIVSRGLARETTRIPRIFNRPELVIVDVE